jgi:sugar fermentation stimulation protein A
MPHDTMDKNFGEALREANKAGVDIFAYECDVDINNITLTKPVEICLD